MGQLSIKQQEDSEKKKLINDIKKTQLYNDIIKTFPDANLNNVILNKEDEDK